MQFRDPYSFWTSSNSVNELHLESISPPPLPSPPPCSPHGTGGWHWAPSCKMGGAHIIWIQFFQNVHTSLPWISNVKWTLLEWRRKWTNPCFVSSLLRVTNIVRSSHNKISDINTWETVKMESQYIWKTHQRGLCDQSLRTTQGETSKNPAFIIGRCHVPVCLYLLPHSGVQRF